MTTFRLLSVLGSQVAGAKQTKLAWSVPEMVHGVTALSRRHDRPVLLCKERTLPSPLSSSSDVFLCFSLARRHVRLLSES